jgi:hypothetical protein
MTTALARPDNLRIWEALGKTDPSATKQFQRAGGFRGTAIRPMWSNKRMTEYFGPCGIGWGQTEPQFQVIPADGEIMVYCTVGVWYVDGGEKRGPVYGVGGDKVVVKQKDGLRTDDEAFKKAYTDAVGNATKFIGVGADVHMGLFDDSKYVQSMVEEFSDPQKDAVFAEVERQRAEAKKLTIVDVSTGITIPPELEFSYNKASGVLIARIMAASVKSKKDDPTKEFTILKLNGKIDGSTKEQAYYWHSTHKAMLLNSIGTIAKFVVEPKGDFPTITEVLEVDGVKVENGPSVETQARLLASTMDFSEDELMLTHKKLCQSSWDVTLVGLQNEKKRREAAEVQPA